MKLWQAEGNPSLGEVACGVYSKRTLYSALNLCFWRFDLPAHLTEFEGSVYLPCTCRI